MRHATPIFLIIGKQNSSCEHPILLFIIIFILIISSNYNDKVSENYNHHCEFIPEIPIFNFRGGEVLAGTFLFPNDYSVRTSAFESCFLLEHCFNFQVANKRCSNIIDK